MPNTAYEAFLDLGNFAGKERQLLLPRWVEAATRLGLTEQDVAYAVDEFIPEMWDLQYLGIRKMIGAMTLEAIDHAHLREHKANGVKLVYGIIPAILTPYQAVKKAGGDKVFVSFPDMCIMNFLQPLFHRGAPLFELAETSGLTYGCRHCALNKLRIGLRLRDVVPAPHVQWSFGLVCDEATKVDEYINCLYDDDWFAVITRLPHDTVMGEVDDELPERVAYLANAFRDAYEEVQRVTGVTVREEHIAGALEDFQRYLMKTDVLIRAVAEADPQPLRGSALVNFCHPFSMPFNTGIEHMEDALDTMIEEVKAEVAAGRGIYPKGAPKLGSYFVPYAVPWVDKVFMDNGVATGSSLTMIASDKQLIPPSGNDLYKNIAEQWLRMVFGMGCHVEIATWIEKVNRAKPDALFMGFFDYDRWLGQMHKMGAREVEKATGVPTFYIEADFFDDRDYSREALRTRIESISQVIKMRKAAKAAAERAAAAGAAAAPGSA
jgi:benzoyl-CoA reductase/2-hydroxyglutaryl-CoA dehydratase subunit BcrC/BadD/HgdB